MSDVRYCIKRGACIGAMPLILGTPRRRDRSVGDNANLMLTQPSCFRS